MEIGEDILNEGLRRFFGAKIIDMREQPGQDAGHQPDVPNHEPEPGEQLMLFDVGPRIQAWDRT